MIGGTCGIHLVSNYTGSLWFSDELYFRRQIVSQSFFHNAVQPHNGSSVRSLGFEATLIDCVIPPSGGGDRASG